MDNPDKIPVYLLCIYLCLLSTLMRKSGKTSRDTPPGDWDKTRNQHADAVCALLFGLSVLLDVYKHRLCRLGE